MKKNQKDRNAARRRQSQEILDLHIKQKLENHIIGVIIVSILVLFAHIIEAITNIIKDEHDAKNILLIIGHLILGSLEIYHWYDIGKKDDFD
jgi:hypothetical protein